MHTEKAFAAAHSDDVSNIVHDATDACKERMTEAAYTGLLPPTQAQQHKAHKPWHANGPRALHFCSQQQYHHHLARCSSLL
jgi:hypothetical protein